MEIRNLDPVFFRTERDGKWMNLCFTDLTEEERDKATQKWGADNWKRMCFLLADIVREIGDTFDLIGRE